MHPAAGLGRVLSFVVGSELLLLVHAADASGRARQLTGGLVWTLPGQANRRLIVRRPSADRPPTADRSPTADGEP